MIGNYSGGLTSNIIYRGTSTWTGGGNDYDPNSTAWGFTNWNTISNADALCQAEMVQLSEEMLKMMEAAESRRRDLSYLVPRPLKRLRYHVVAPRIRFMPVLRQPRCVHRCHRRVVRCPGQRRQIVCRRAGLVALRVNARA